MKAGETIDAIATFFNDIIGAIVPGAALCLGLWIMHSPKGIEPLLKTGDGAVALMLTGLFFAAGHATLSLFDLFNKLLKKHIPLLDDTAYSAKAAGSTAYAAFEKLAVAKLKMSHRGSELEAEKKWSFNDMRSIAFTVSQEAGALGRRFMFISLLCQGMCSAIVVIALDYLMCLLFAPRALVAYANAWPAWVQLSLLAATAYLFLTRARTFYSMAMSAPFVVALSDVTLKMANDARSKD